MTLSLPCCVCRWCGQPGLARKVEVGFAAFLITNSPAVDRNHKFSSTHLRRLAAALHPAEHDEYMLVWQPTAGSTLNPTRGYKTMSDVSTSSSSSMSRENLVREMRSVPCNWTTFTLNMGAFLYKSLFGMDVEPEGKVSNRAVLRSLGIENQAEVPIQHFFKAYK